MPSSKFSESSIRVLISRVRSDETHSLCRVGCKVLPGTLDLKASEACGRETGAQGGRRTFVVLRQLKCEIADARVVSEQQNCVVALGLINVLELQQRDQH